MTSHEQHARQTNRCAATHGASRKNSRIARRLDQLERKVGSHDRAILEILQALRQLTQPAETPKRRRIGFVQD